MLQNLLQLQLSCFCANSLIMTTTKTMMIIIRKEALKSNNEQEKKMVFETSKSENYAMTFKEKKRKKEIQYQYTNMYVFHFNMNQCTYCYFLLNRLVVERALPVLEVAAYDPRQLHTTDEMVHVHSNS